MKIAIVGYEQDGHCEHCGRVLRNNGVRCCCMKPKVGDVVLYTDLGSGVYYQLNGCWPPSNGIFGVVVESSTGESICAVQGTDLQTHLFIWRFQDELNTHFKWPGKHNKDSAGCSNKPRQGIW